MLASHARVSRLDFRYPTPLIDATLVRRYKRFLADVTLEDGTTLTVHCANPGSMKGLDLPGRPVRISDSGNPKRKLPHSLEQVKPGRAWVGVNTALPNRVVHAALRGGVIETLRGYEDIRPEVASGAGSRFDFLLTRRAERCWVEVKNVSLREAGEARFPDARTERGLKHLDHLMALRAAGDRCVMLYFVPRADVHAFRPAWDIDPDYAQRLEQAAAAGVEVLPVRATVSRLGLGVGPILPYDLAHG